MFSTRDLAVYAAIVGTLSGAWTLYASIVLDRARIRVSAYEGQAITPTTMSPGGASRTPVLMVSASNRGRRGASIQTVCRVLDMKRVVRMELSSDITKQLTKPVRLGEGEGHTFVHGAGGGHVLGGMSTRRWFVVDGGGRIHPLRERWRQRMERVIYWPIRTGASPPRAEPLSQNHRGVVEFLLIGKDVAVGVRGDCKVALPDVLTDPCPTVFR